VLAAPRDPVPPGLRAVVGAGPDTVVPVGQLLIGGDNPSSVGSNRWGYFPGSRLLGVVIRRLPPA
jgi:hypothetical protein